jgi:hypothetical protein
VRDLLAAVVEAVTVPEPATAQDQAGHDAVLAERAALVRGALRALLSVDGALGVALLGAQAATVRGLVAGLTPAGRYTVAPAVYGVWACVRCGARETARRDVCDECGGAGSDVVRLDRDRDSTEDHAPPAGQWPAAHPGWRDDEPTVSGWHTYTRTVGALVWQLTAIPLGGADTSWHLEAGGWEMTSPPYHRRHHGREYPRTAVVLDIVGPQRTPQHALVMADRFIAGYLAARGTQPPTVDGDAEGGA